MADGTKIEWADATANYVNGCSVMSPGCTNCYAMRLAGTRMRNHPTRAGLTSDSKAGPVWNGQVRENPAALEQVLRWKKPRAIFWNAHGDLFHENVPDEWIDRQFAVMALTPQHRHMVLTKRSARMREYVASVWGNHDAEIERSTAAVNYAFRLAGFRGTWGNFGSTGTAITTIGRGTGAREYGMLRRLPDGGVERFYWHGGEETWTRCSNEFSRRVPAWGAHESEFGWGLKQWPLPNVWLGVSVEDQRRADERIPDLLATPAEVRFISAEPLLGPVNLTNIDCDGRGLGMYWINALTGEHDDMCRPCQPVPHLDWVIVGGESGPGSRPMHPDWARSLRDQCKAAGVAFHFKQWGNWAPICEMSEEAIDACYHPAPANNPDASRRLKVGQCVMHQDGTRFDGDAMYSRPAFEQGSRAMTMMAIGKARAGRLLDGVTHDGVPK